LHAGFLLFNPAHFRHAGSGVEQSGETIELGGSSNGIDLHPAVILITDPARQADLLGMLDDEPPETNSLYATGNEPAPGGGRGTAQCCCSSIMAGSMVGFPFSTSSTDSARRCRVNGLATSAKPFSIT